MGPPPIDGRGALPKAIVLAPTRELASQIHLDARRLTFGSSARSVCVYGGNDIRNQLVELCLGCDVIVATPGRLNDLVERGIVSLSQVNFLVLDEADRMLDMGFEVSFFFVATDEYVTFVALSASNS
jgi:ATP-dependent RNA helicase DDX3X